MILLRFLKLLDGADDQVFRRRLAIETDAKQVNRAVN